MRYSELPPDFRRLIVARFLYSLAVRIQAVVVGWTMYALTHDPLHLGLVGLAEAVPALGLAIWAGYVVDRSRPLNTYLGVILASLLSALVVLFSQTVPCSLTQQIGALYLSSVLGGVARAFSQPSMFALAPRLVARSQLSQATAYMSSTLQGASVAGPAAAGLLYGWCGVVPATALATSMLCAACLAARAIQTLVEPPQPDSNRRASRAEELLSGARFVFAHPLLLPALTLDMLSVFFAGVTALLPIFAAEVLHVGPGGLGALRAAPALGAALVTFFVMARCDFRSQAGRWLLGAVAAFGLCILGFGCSHNFWLSLILLVLSGGFDSVSAVIRNTAVQLASPDAMRGRISAINSMFIGSSNELGEFESGVAARLLGTVPAVLLGGAACLLTVAAIAWLSPALRRLDLRRLEEAAV